MCHCWQRHDDRWRAGGKQDLPTGSTCSTSSEHGAATFPPNKLTHPIPRTTCHGTDLAAFCTKIGPDCTEIGPLWTESALAFWFMSAVFSCRKACFRYRRGLFPYMAPSFSACICTIRSRPAGATATGVNCCRIVFRRDNWSAFQRPSLPRRGWIDFALDRGTIRKTGGVFSSDRQSF